jgi:hypothetical protein
MLEQKCQREPDRGRESQREREEEGVTINTPICVFMFVCVFQCKRKTRFFWNRY